MVNNILEIEGLYKNFSKAKLGKDDETYSLISNLSVSIPENSISALIGGNATGKTTLFNILSGFLKEDRGNIYFYNPKTTNLKNIPSFKREHLGIGRLFQDNHIFPSLTVIENLIIAGRNNLKGNSFEAIFRTRRIKEAEEALTQKATETIVHLFGKSHELISKLNDEASSLSFGQKRLVGLLRLFMSDYKLVLLDEPTSGINPALNDVISEIIKQMVLENGMTVFLIEHNMNFVRKTAQNCFFLDDGMIKMQGSPSEVLGNKFVQQSYLGA